MEKQIILVNWNRFYPDKPFRLLDEFMDKLKTEPKFVFKDFDTLDKTISFFEENAHCQNMSIVLPTSPTSVGKFNSFLTESTAYCNYLQTLNNTKLTFYIIPSDTFLNPATKDWYVSIAKIDKPFVRILLSHIDNEDYLINNIKLADMSKHHLGGISLMPSLPNPEKIIFWERNHCNSTMYVQFNDAPINKVALSGHASDGAYRIRGQIHSWLNSHTQIYERIPPNRNTEFFSADNIFSKKLNKYIANIYTPVYTYYNSLTLFKLYEIMACGSLILVPECCEKVFTKMGMENNVHYKLIDTTNKTELLKTINYVLDTNNRPEIDMIRHNGVEFCKKNLNVDKCFENFVHCFE